MLRYNSDQKQTRYLTSGVYRQINECKSETLISGPKVCAQEEMTGIFDPNMEVR